MTSEQFAQKAADKFNEELTDLVFQYIENDAELMHDYLRLGLIKTHSYICLQWITHNFAYQYFKYSIY